MMSKRLSAAPGTVYKTDADIPYAHLISSHTAYIIYLSNSLCSSLLLASQVLNDLHDLVLACSYSTVISEVDSRPEKPSDVRGPLYKSQDLFLKGTYRYSLLLHSSLHAFGPVL